ncbi:sigma-54 dependent transcriptional regulator [bacterium]|nr:sigma-54 dependent transcriptional regulator [bacterium]
MNGQHQIAGSCFTQKKPFQVLVVDRRRRTTTALQREFGNNVRIEHAATADTAMQMLALSGFDLVVLHLRLTLFSGIDFARQVKKKLPNLPILSFCPSSIKDTAEEMTKIGFAASMISDIDNTIEIADSCREYMETVAWLHKINELRSELKHKYNYNKMLSLTSEILNIYKDLTKISNANVPILVTGESGTGKELVAHMIHSTSSRSEKPFITVNCAAVPEGLLESQFFGHEKGAFTGAVNRMAGKFEIADGGTLFLDEIGEMSPALQAKVLRVIEYGEFERIGGNDTIRVNVRLITATNRNLEDMVKDGSFREDLLYRINVFPIHLPSLKDRQEDIAILTYYFLKTTGERNKRRIDRINSDVFDLLCSYPWHGNVRELQNAVERALLLSDGVKLRVEDFPHQLEWIRCQDTIVDRDEIDNLGKAEVRPLKDVEKDVIISALKVNDGNIALTARQLGIGRNTLYRKIDEHGLQSLNQEEG